MLLYVAVCLDMSMTACLDQVKQKKDERSSNIGRTAVNHSASTDGKTLRLRPFTVVRKELEKRKRWRSVKEDDD